MVMLIIAGCLIVVFCVLLLLVLGNYLFDRQLLKGEYSRKFVHITVGTFVAFWPWIISWREIQVLGLLMLAGVFINHRKKIFKFSKGIHRKTYGDYFYAMTITLCALLTTNKVFFAIAILHLALADGLAAVIGTEFGKMWRYKMFNQTKTILGSMAFWVTSLYILGLGVLFANSNISFNSYALLLLLLPPALTIIENFAVLGLDNITVPLIVLLALSMA